jgi:antitoxin component YwqK of YwqJK toxin-antitoxin module
MKLAIFSLLCIFCLAAVAVAKPAANECKYNTSDLWSINMIDEENDFYEIYTYKGELVDGMACDIEDGRYIRYKNGRLHGKSESYNGDRLYESIPYKNGFKDGMCRYYGWDGQLRAETPYKKGYINGIAKEYDEVGKITSAKSYKMGIYLGRLEGVDYTSGKSMWRSKDTGERFERYYTWKVPYKDGKIDGTLEYKWGSGLAATFNYQKGKVISGSCSADGRTIKKNATNYEVVDFALSCVDELKAVQTAANRTTNLPKGCQYNWFDVNHDLRDPFSGHELMTDGMLPVTGVVCQLHNNDKAQVMTPYKNGVISGVEKVYNEDGKLVTERSYTHEGNLGAYKYYYENGSVDYINTPNKNKAGSVGKSYDENGVLSSEYVESDAMLHLSKYYDKNGKLVYAVFHAGWEDYGLWKGEICSYYEEPDADGYRVLKVKASFEAGQKNGKALYYNKDGSLNATINYKAGKPISAISRNGRKWSSKQLAGWSKSNNDQSYYIFQDSNCEEEE